MTVLSPVTSSPVLNVEFWQTLRLSETTCRQAFEAAAAREPEPSADLDGRGVIIPGGGEKYLPGAYVAAGMLRRLGCSLPIELWHLGEQELPRHWRAPLADLGVQAVDALELRRRHPVRRLAGFELKAFALVHSRFSEVLLLDADNVPVQNPTFLFESTPYREHGAIFWPDYGASRGDLATGTLSASHPIWELCGLPYRGDREFESGQICVDKRRCQRELLLSLWLNQYSDFWYRYLWGDKDTFHIAWRKLGRKWAMPARGPIDLMGLVMGQCDFEGRVLFQHRNGAKWSLQDNPRITGFVREDECFELLEELRASLEVSRAAVDSSLPGLRIAVDISAGELVDRITILEIKAERLPASREAVARELAAACALRDRNLPSGARLHALTDALRLANRELWDVEDELRGCELTQSFDDRFVELSRRVYITNDRRAALKRAIDELLGSDVREHKSHVLPDI